jgi:hypothetical protein
MNNITIQQGYRAMIDFLENYYDRTQSDDVGGLLGDLMLLEDGTSADSAAWEDWLNSVQKVVPNLDVQNNKV